jgi:DNA polymerase-3 subunit gamma/tau
MILLRMLAFKPVTGTPARTSSETKTTPASSSVNTTEKPAVPAPASPAVSHTVTNDWITLLGQLELKGMSYTLASHCAIEDMSENVIRLVISKKHEAFHNPDAIKRIEEALVKYFQRPITLHITLTGNELHTVAKHQENHQTARLASAVEAIKTDGHVQKIMDIFDATLDVKSIKAVDPA